jgi:hypothetical protein
MAWGKRIIICLGLLLIAHVARARDIDTFTDSQGTLHITNSGSTKQKGPATIPNSPASLYPGELPGKAPVAPPVKAVAPTAPAPAPKPEAPPAGPIPVAPQRGSQVIHSEGSTKVMQVADRTGGRNEPGIAAIATQASLQQVSWSPPRPVNPVSNGKISILRDWQGVIHISNVLLEVEEPAPPVTPAPVVQTLPPEAALPAVQQVSCPGLGPEVANYLEDQLRAYATALTGQSIHRSRDRRGVWNIVNQPSPDPPLPPALQACIIEAAQQYRLPISLVLALIRKESNFAHQAVSPKGAMGLMQLMPGTAASLGVGDPFDPRENILAGCRYFRSLLDYFQGNVPLAVAGYNAGYHRVISAGFRVPAIKETQEFVTQVMGLYYLLEKQAESL